MKLNEDKCHLILFGASKERVVIHISETQIEENDEEKLLGKGLDKNLSFKKHVQMLYKTASQKLHALACISVFKEPEKLKLSMKKCRYVPVNNCPLIWMFHDINLSNKINKIYERSVRIACKVNVSSSAPKPM